MLIALTGGLACGKSTALKIFEELGFHTLDSDNLVQEIYEKNTDVRKAIQEQLGPQILTVTGVDRNALAKIVFGNPELLAWLENLVHPKVKQLRDTYIAQAPDQNWVVEIPLLFEKNLDVDFDFTICLSSQMSLQLSRLSSKGITLEDAKSRIASQLPLQLKEERANYVIYNNQTIEDLRTQIYQLAQKLKSRFA